MNLKQSLIHAATAYDAKQQRSRFYNPNALGIMFERIDAVCADVESGASVRSAIMAGFNDRLLTVMLKAAGEADFTAQESNSAGMVYTPVGGAK